MSDMGTFAVKKIKTIRVRVKDNHAPVLVEMARSVNTVWNYLNEISHRSISEKGKFLSFFDMHPYTVGAAKMLGLHSHTVKRVAKAYVDSRNQFKKSRLQWRKSSGKRSLGWIPVSNGAASWKNGCIRHNGYRFKVWDSYGLGQYKFLTASFSEDARGRWYFNAAVEISSIEASGDCEIGVDLGLKTIATCSDGVTLENGRFYRNLEPALAAAQRAGKRSRARSIHAKIANQRKDALHKFSSALVSRCKLIVVGDIKSRKLSKTTLAKSVNDAGWFMLKTMLSYKCDHAGIIFKVVDEAYTTQTCSDCGSMPDSRPKGIAGLGMREWACSECGVTHDRDVNAAKNILALGHERPVVGICAT